jgi:hypothetical protein
MAHDPQSTAPAALEDHLETLMELARQASPEDRLRIGPWQRFRKRRYTSQSNPLIWRKTHLPDFS